MEALAHQSQIGYVLGLQESLVVAMADGYARVTGKPGVAVVTAGPGLTDAVTGVASTASASTTNGEFAFVGGMTVLGT